MIRLPDGNKGRIAAFGIGAITIAAIYIGVIAPLSAFYDHGRQKLEERLEAVRRLESSAADLPRLWAAAQQWREKTRDGDFLLVGSSDTLAGASLQSTLKDLVEQNGAKLNSAEILPSDTSDKDKSERDKFRRVGVRVAFSGDLTLITTVLHGIETSHPVIFVDNLDIHTTDNSSGADGGQSFTIALDVHGFRSL